MMSTCFTLNTFFWNGEPPAAMLNAPRAVHAVARSRKRMHGARREERRDTWAEGCLSPHRGDESESACHAWQLCSPSWHTPKSPTTRPKRIRLLCFPRIRYPEQAIVWDISTHAAVLRNGRPVCTQRYRAHTRQQPGADGTALSSRRRGTAVLRVHP